jgi:hypothetical protein
MDNPEKLATLRTQDEEKQELARAMSFWNNLH